MSETKYSGKCLIIKGGKKGERALVIGDLHLGYETGLGIGGLDLGGEKTEEIIREIDQIFGEKRFKKTKKIILLGDLKHGFSELNEEEKREITKLLDFLGKKCEEIIILRGNHDNYLDNLTSRRKIKTEKIHSWLDNLFVHGDCEDKEIWKNNVRRIIMGHFHPSVRISDGTKTEVYKCFVEGKQRGKEIIIVPSFSETGRGLDVRELKGTKWKFKWKDFRVKVAGTTGDALDFGKIKNLGN